MMSGVLNWKVCRKCWKPFDIGTNLDICPACRLEERVKLLEEIDKQRISAEAQILRIKKERENGR